MSKGIIKWYIRIQYLKVKKELMQLRIQRVSILERREHKIAGCPEEYIPVC